MNIVIINSKGQTWNVATRTWLSEPHITCTDKLDYMKEAKIARKNAEAMGMYIDCFPVDPNEDNLKGVIAFSLGVIESMRAK